MGPDNEETQDEALSLDAALELLANRQRRVILRFFIDSDSNSNHAPVDEIISEIITEEARATGERPGHDSVAATLFHVHLPKFSEAGILDYDSRHLDISYHGDNRVEKLYQKIQELQEDDSW